MATINYTSKVTGTFTKVSCTENGKPIKPNNSNEGVSFNFTENLTAGSILVVIYDITAMNGTDFTIEYHCIANGQPRSDPAMPSPHPDTIDAFNNKVVTISITI